MWGAYKEDWYSIVDPYADDVPDDVIDQYKHDRIEHDCLGCTDCKWCEQEDGKCYCTADPYEPEIEDDSPCDKFDNYTDWEGEFRKEREGRKWDMWDQR